MVSPERLLDPALAPVWEAADRLPRDAGPAETERFLQAARRAGADAALARAAAQQSQLRRRAATTFGVAADGLLFTRSGLEQATRPVVAGRRADRLAAAGFSAFADLGCGIGIDSIAAARLGLAVLAIERDPETAAIAAANLRAHCAARVVTADAATEPVPPDHVAFVDPGRRAGYDTTGAARRVLDPERWQPPWSWLRQFAGRHPATVAKVAPGISHDLLPAGAEVEWVSVAGDLVEATVWFPGAASEPGTRHAVVLWPGQDPWTPASEARLTATGEREAAAGPLGGWLLEPDPAVIRSHLIADLCAVTGGRLLSPGIAYLTTDVAPRTPFAKAWPIEGVLPADPRALRAVLRARGVGSAEIRTRGLALDPERFRHELRLGRGDTAAHLAVTRVQGRPAALLLGERSARVTGDP